MPYSYKLGKAIPQIVVDDLTKPLSELVGQESLFDKLKLAMLEIEWIKINPTNLDLFLGFLKYKEFVLSLHAVNDCAERGIKLAQDFLKSLGYDSDAQASLFVVVNHRQKLKIT